MVIRTCAHICVCNSKALEICNITKDTIVPAGGMMYMGEDGKPNGIFAETAHGLITKNIPPYTKDELKIMVNAAQEEMLQYGITAATDPAVEPLLLQAYKEMNHAGELKFRLNALPVILPDGEKILGEGHRDTGGDSRARPRRRARFAPEQGGAEGREAPQQAAPRPPRATRSKGR